VLEQVFIRLTTLIPVISVSRQYPLDGPNSGRWFDNRCIGGLLAEIVDNEAKMPTEAESRHYMDPKSKYLFETINIKGFKGADPFIDKDSARKFDKHCCVCPTVRY
jgi:hypothetical protein